MLLSAAEAEEVVLVEVLNVKLIVTSATEVVILPATAKTRTGVTGNIHATINFT